MNTYVISAEDRDRILEFLRSYKPVLFFESEQMTLLKEKLNNAVIVPEQNMARTIISMYSSANVLDLTSRQTHLYTLVYPHHANPSRRRLSLLSPLGTALLGCDQGNFFECTIGGKTFQFAVKDVLLRPKESRKQNA